MGLGIGLGGLQGMDYAGSQKIFSWDVTGAPCPMIFVETSPPVQLARFWRDALSYCHQPEDAVVVPDFLQRQAILLRVLRQQIQKHHAALIAVEHVRWPVAALGNVVRQSRDDNSLAPRHMRR
jgi:hypothetical protein